MYIPPWRMSAVGRSASRRPAPTPAPPWAPASVPATVRTRAPPVSGWHAVPGRHGSWHAASYLSVVHGVVGVVHGRVGGLSTTRGSWRGPTTGSVRWGAAAVLCRGLVTIIETWLRVRTTLCLYSLLQLRTMHVVVGYIIIN